MNNKSDVNKYRMITERYCSEIGENVVLISSFGDTESYECLQAHTCNARDRCQRCHREKSTEKRSNPA